MVLGWPEGFGELSAHFPSSNASQQNNIRSERFKLLRRVIDNSRGFLRILGSSEIPCGHPNRLSRAIAASHHHQDWGEKLEKSAHHYSAVIANKNGAG